MKKQIKYVSYLVLMGIVAVGIARAEEMVKIALELPKAMFVGTPKNVKTKNLERPGTQRVTTMMAPAGTVNLAKDKAVESSDAFPVIGELSYVVDGDKEGADGSYVELGPGVQWVQVDLGAAHDIYGISFWHFHSEGRVYRDVVIQVADDKDFITNVQTVFNNDHDNSAGLGVGKDKEYVETNKGRLVEAKNVKGRFVRLYSNGSTSTDMNHYIEVEVFGK
ncbi:MAG: discoidin domain-containing protein [Kiritimatiellales bacterium]|nr:discoidin domain-containing protein [Kiritimatiellales bacterium]